MGWLEGMLSGFSARKGEVEAQTLEESRRAQEREARVYETLINSPDPETRTLALAGLFESARPRTRAGGLRGWLGELEQSPYLAQIQALSPTVETEEPTYGLPSRQTSGFINQPPGPAPAALPPWSPTEVGAPPPTPVSPAPAPSQIVTRQVTAPVTGTRTVSKPRRMFRTPEEQILLEKTAAAKGDVLGDVEAFVAGGMPREEALRTAVEMRMRRGGVAGQSYAEGNIEPDPDRPGQWRQRLYLRADPSVSTFVPAQAPLTPEEIGKRATAGAQARAGVAAGAPLSTAQRFQATTDLQTAWRKAEGPLREMQRQLELMETGLRRFREGDKIGGSQAVLVTFQKILDPTSVVRETEYARTPQGLSLLQRIEGYRQRLIEGGAGVPDQELAAMTETARQFLQGMGDWNALERGRIQSTAQEYQIEPSLIFGVQPGVGTPPPAGVGAGARGPANLFLGPDGELHVGSPTGPLYQ